VEGAGQTGIVEEVTPGYVRLCEYDGTVHFVPTVEIDTVTNRRYGRVYAVLDVAVETDADFGATFEVIRKAAGELQADPEFAGRIVGPGKIAGFERRDDDAMLIRPRIPVAADSQVPVRRAWLARLKAGMDLAGIPNPTQRLRLPRAPHRARIRPHFAARRRRPHEARVRRSA